MKSVSNEGGPSKFVVPGLQTNGKVVEVAECGGVIGLLVVVLLLLILLPLLAVALDLPPFAKSVSLSRMRRRGFGGGVTLASWACNLARSLFFCSAKMRSVSASRRATSCTHCC